jgi:hypothetical protein
MMNPHIVTQRLLRRIKEELYGHFDSKTVIVALHKERTLYFAVPKAASTSIEFVLTDVIRQRLPDELRDKMDDGWHYFRGGEKRKEMRDRQILLCKHEVPKYSDYYSFAFVRNPWSRLVSCYRDKVEHKPVNSSTDPKSAPAVLIGRNIASEYATFEEFATAVCDTPDKRSNRHFRSQHVFLTDNRGRLMPKEVYHFEELPDAFDQIMDRIGLPQVGLPKRNASKKHSFQEYYTPRLRDMVAERYKVDIELFGYTFESPEA